MYYPNIAEGSLEGGTNIFPANIKIGFILKSHGWGMQGTDYVIKGFADNDRKYNARYPQDLRTRSRLTSIPTPMATAARRSLPTTPPMATSMPSSPSRMPATTRTTTTWSSHSSPSMPSSHCPRLNPTASSPRVSMPSRTCGLPRATTI